MKKQICLYKPQVLVDMAQEYLDAENDAHIFYRSHRPFPGALLDLRTVEDRITYERHDTKTTYIWSAFIDACKLVNADPDTVMGTVKAMNRYERRMQYQDCARLPRGYSRGTHEYGDVRTRRYWAKPDPDDAYFKTTGRQMPWSMNKYFYTFGSDPKFPYQNGWVEIYADTYEQAHEKFRARFPDRHENTLNCAFFYDENQWAKMDPEHKWHGWKCFGVIK